MKGLIMKRSVILRVMRVTAGVLLPAMLVVTAIAETSQEPAQAPTGSASEEPVEEVNVAPADDVAAVPSEEPTPTLEIEPAEASAAGSVEEGAEQPPGESESHAILRRADESRGNLQGVQWLVEIDALESGKRQQHTLNVGSRGYDFLAIFLAPPRAKGQRVLFVNRNMWFSKPGTRKPVPISSRQKLAGGAAYGDIAATNYSDDYAATRLDDETIDGVACYVFDLKAVGKKSTYDRIVYWVSMERDVGVKADYYTVSGKRIKSARFAFDHQVEVNGEQRPFISRIEISDAIIEANVTTMEFSTPELKVLPDSTFNVNLLTRW